MKDYLNTLKDLYYKLEILNEGKINNEKKLKKLKIEDKILNSRFKDINYNIDMNIHKKQNLKIIASNIKGYRNKGLVTTILTILMLLMGSLIGPIALFSAVLISIPIVLLGFSKYMNSKLILESNKIEDIDQIIAENLEDKKLNREKYEQNRKQIQLYQTIINNIDMDIKKLLENVIELEGLCSELVKKVLQEEKTLNIFNQVLEEEIKTNNKIYLKKKNNSN